MKENVYYVNILLNMSYHKHNLKAQLVDVAWEICLAESWQSVNMRKVAKKAEVSTTAFYRHFRNKNDLKAELMRRGFKLIEGGRKSANTFAGYGAYYIRFGLDYPHIYDLMFGNIDLEIDIHLYPDLKAQFDASFDGLVEGLRPFMPDTPEEDLMVKAVNIWASCHGLVGILRRQTLQHNISENLEWIENTLEEYLRITTFR